MQVESKTAILRVLLVAAVCLPLSQQLLSAQCFTVASARPPHLTWLEIKLAVQFAISRFPPASETPKILYHRIPLRRSKAASYFLTQCSGCHS